MGISQSQQIRAMACLRPIADEWNLANSPVDGLLKQLLALEAALDANDPAAFDVSLTSVVLAEPTLADGKLPEPGGPPTEQEVLVVLARLQERLTEPPPEPPAPAAGPASAS
ncbi:hypothetical protein ACIHCQ_33245 [Streptomyces sp. NPDC052236]|uniref:hypothetical protein n=1 Tax=Streptomyces sp. NPDC052236 TaxID=3365686 RepID=UPI0037D03F6E